MTYTTKSGKKNTLLTIRMDADIESDLDIIVDDFGTDRSKLVRAFVIDGISRVEEDEEYSEHLRKVLRY